MGKKYMVPAFHELQGQIISSGFASGHRVVAGVWQTGPLGPMSDIMWVQPDNRRVLIAPTQPVADFIAGIYDFDEVVIDDVEVMRMSRRTRVRTGSGSVDLSVVAGHRIPIPLGRLRSRHFTRWVESPIARRLLKVTTYGLTARGVHEWYRADAVAFVTQATLAVGGVDAGSWGSVSPALGIGITDPPRRASITDVRPLLSDSTGNLDQVVAKGLVSL